MIIDTSKIIKLADKDRFRLEYRNVSLYNYNNIKFLFFKQKFKNITLDVDMDIYGRLSTEVPCSYETFIYINIPKTMKGYGNKFIRYFAAEKNKKLEYSWSSHDISNTGWPVSQMVKVYSTDLIENNFFISDDEYYLCFSDAGWITKDTTYDDIIQHICAVLPQVNKFEETTNFLWEHYINEDVVDKSINDLNFIKWCEKNTPTFKVIGSHGMSLLIEFKNEDDLLLAKLRWG